MGRGETRDSVLRLVPPGRICAEIGVFRGDFSARILELTRPRVLHLVDPWKFEPDPVYVRALYGGRSGSQAAMDAVYGEVLLRFSAEIAAGRVVLHRETSGRFFESIGHEQLDWAYIDGNHLYECVKLDLELGLRRVKPDGLLVCDDYRTQGWWDDGVTRAVDEILARGSASLVTVCGGQVVLRKRMGGPTALR